MVSASGTVPPQHAGSSGRLQDSLTVYESSGKVKGVFHYTKRASRMNFRVIVNSWIA